MYWPHDSYKFAQWHHINERTILTQEIALSPCPNLCASVLIHYSNLGSRLHPTVCTIICLCIFSLGFVTSDGYNTRPSAYSSSSGSSGNSRKVITYSHFFPEFDIFNCSSRLLLYGWVWSLSWRLNWSYKQVWFVSPKPDIASSSVPQSSNVVQKLSNSSMSHTVALGDGFLH